MESVLNKKRKVTVEKICRKWRFKPEMKEWRGVVSVVSPYRVPIFPFADQGLICRSRVSAFSFTVSRQILVDWCMSPLVGETKNLTKFAIWRSLHHESGLLFHAKFHVDRCIASPWGVKKKRKFEYIFQQYFDVAPPISIQPAYHRSSTKCSYSYNWAVVSL